MWRTVSADIQANVYRPPSDGPVRWQVGYWVKVAGKLLITPAVQVVVLHRVAAALARTPLRPLAFVLRSLSVTLGGAEIHPDARLGPGFALVHSTGVVIGGGVLAGRRCRLSQGVTLGEKGRATPHARNGSPTLGDEVEIGAGAVILGPVRIGDRAIVGANAVVTADVPADTIVGGNPAKVLRSRDTA
ncbi:serine O-acetyltransferase [Nocardioides limicola]|uniref:serine O-acetyltransferase n=1 Tax=Nocardioides limicola TaxID=2803368 RepID=UPI00193B8FB1|nr:DapH/DapD/GlmU-related protein [Nocardioides sp. DJM-14]